MLDRSTGGILAHRVFRDLAAYLRPFDVLVLNDTRVLPVRLRGRLGGEVEVLLLRPVSNPAPAPASAGLVRFAGTWEALVRPGRRLRPGTRLVFGDGAIEVTVGPPAERERGVRLVTVRHAGELRAVLERVGEMPVPPYIERPLDDPNDYQTVYAERPGAVAAPTAGLHMTPGLLEAVRRQGVRVVRVTLHVGLGTFRGVRTEDVMRHRMDAESYEVGDETAAVINGVRARGGRVVAVGTTVVRTLESVATDAGTVAAGRGRTELFITPGYRFRVTDALVTNFHLPRTTLLMLVSAFAGRERVLAAYAEAIRLRYRFYSFGDAMLIL